ncbi:type II secretion system F family protein [Bacillus piscicola]|uniref:type II secretion system F family protein n=1 Tax=Bacillus piscicola TaxID=1632684 RepID=UPI001F0962CC|nr:hypothetical protein [Bacillus piscicola]
MDLKIYAIIVGFLVFWAIVRIMIPKKASYASDDFIRAENIEEVERNIIHRSLIHQITYPIYQKVEAWRPTNDEYHDRLLKLIEEAGEHDTTPEDIQIGQLFNAILYPLIFTVLSFFVGDYQVYVFLFGLVAGFYMYRTPIRGLRAKVKKNDQQMLEDMTRFTTIYMLISAGNKTPYDAIINSIERTEKRTPALGLYLTELKNEMLTRTPEEALRRFSERLVKFPYVERFVNNIILAMQKGDSNNQEINIRLRETLNDMDDEMTNKKIEDKKAQARVPTYAGVLVISIYMVVVLMVTMFMVF